MTCGKVREKRGASSLLLARNVEREKRVLVFQKWWIFSERVSNFSLGFWPIEPSDLFGPRSKVDSHDKGYAWAPVSGVFDKLHEVGVLLYLI